MAENHILYGNIAMLIVSIGYLPYILSIFRKKTKPHRTTWLVLFIIGLITLLAYKNVGAHATLGVAFANVVGPGTVFILSLKYGEGWENMKDLKYLIISLIGIILWQIYNSPLIGLVFNLLADFSAFIPTILKSFLKPETEDFLSWGIFTLGNFVNLFAIEQWIFNILIYPLYILIAEGIVFITLLFYHISKKKFLIF